MHYLPTKQSHDVDVEAASASQEVESVKSKSVETDVGYKFWKTCFSFEQNHSGCRYNLP